MCGCESWTEHRRIDAFELDGQRGLTCCGPWGCKGSDTAEQLNWLTDWSVHCPSVMVKLTLRIPWDVMRPSPLRAELSTQMASWLPVTDSITTSFRFSQIFSWKSWHCFWQWLVPQRTYVHLILFGPWPIKLFFKFNFIFKLYNIVLVLPYINMNPPQVYTCSHPEPSSLLSPCTIPLG